jgi:hypothetical protein
MNTLHQFAQLKQQLADIKSKLEAIEPIAVAEAEEALRNGEGNGKTVLELPIGSIRVSFKLVTPKVTDSPKLNRIDCDLTAAIKRLKNKHKTRLLEIDDAIAQLQKERDELLTSKQVRILNARLKQTTDEETTTKTILSFYSNDRKGIEQIDRDIEAIGKRIEAIDKELAS